jgi:predicted nucleic acid-binding protein
MSSPIKLSFPSPPTRTSSPPRSQGRDSLLAATALHHHLRLVTRNAMGFDAAGLETINPWSVG